MAALYSPPEEMVRRHRPLARGAALALRYSVPLANVADAAGQVGVAVNATEPQPFHQGKHDNGVGLTEG